MKIVTWNANSVVKKFKEFKNFLYKNKYDIAGICETKTKKNCKLVIPGYKVYLNSRNSRGGGVAIAIRENIKHFPFNVALNGSIEFVGVKVVSESSSLFVGQVYKPPNKPLLVQDLDSLFSINNILIMGDLNCKRKEWHCSSDNKSGETLLSYCLNNRITIASPQTATNFPTVGKASVIDFFLLKNRLEHSLPFSRCELSSDHNPVEIKIFFDYKINDCTLVYDFAKADWGNFKGELNQNLNLNCHIDSKEALEAQTNLFTNLVTAAIHNHVPVKKLNSHEKSLPMHLKSLITLKNRLRRQLQKRPSPPLKALYSKVVRNVQKKLRLHDAQVFENFVNKLDFKDGSIWKFTRKYTRRAIAPTSLYDSNNHELSSDLERANAFAEYFASLSKGFDDLGNKSFTKKVQDTVRKFMKKSTNPATYNEVKCTSYKEVCSVIKSLKTNKAAGHDAISVRVIKNLPRKAVVFIVKIINGIFYTSHFPSAWKISKVIPLIKKNKDISQISSYRPISLLPVLSKIAEKIIKKRLLSFIAENDLLAKEQFGFREGHSTVDQLARLVNEITSNFNRKLHTGALSLDIEAAFPTVWLIGLLYKLIINKFPPYLILTLYSYLLNRRMFVFSNSTKSKLVDLLAGVPQGSVLGPLLYLIFTNDAPKIKGVDESLFADDKLLLASSFRTSAIAKKLKLAYDANKRYFNKWKTKINDGKTEAIIFTKRRPVISDNVFCGDVKINWSTKIKYLGITLDHKLNFGDHVRSIVQKSINNLIKLYPLFKNKYLSQNSKLTFYKAFIRSAMLYACPVWSSTCRSNIDKLQVVQNTFLRIIGNHRKFTLISLMHEISNIEYISDCIHKYTANYFNKISSHPNVLVRNILYDTNVRYKHKRIMHILQ